MFGLVTMLMGHFGSGALGGHQVALQIASFSFTVCLGISAATSVRVGMAFGNQDPTRARRAGISGMALSGSFMALSGLMLWLTAPQLARFFATPPDVQAAAVSFLGIAAVFQVFDGLQAVASGAIRGTGKTQLAFWLNVASHWGCGVPTALFLAYGMGWKGEGLWWGLTAGLVAGSIVISAAFLPLTRPSHTSRIA
jgi:MATE family multidrug resistance protein